MDFGDACEKLHDDFDILDFFARLYFPIISKAVLIAENWFWVLGHHHNLHFVLNKLEAQLGLEVIMMIFVPPHFQ